MKILHHLFGIAFDMIIFRYKISMEYMRNHTYSQNIFDDSFKIRTYLNPQKCCQTFKHLAISWKSKNLKKSLKSQNIWNIWEILQVPKSRELILEAQMDIAASYEIGGQARWQKESWYQSIFSTSFLIIDFQRWQSLDITLKFRCLTKENHSLLMPMTWYKNKMIHDLEIR